MTRMTLQFIVAMLCFDTSNAVAGDYKNYIHILPSILAETSTPEQIKTFRALLGPVQFTKGAKRFQQGAPTSAITPADLYFATPSNDVIYDFLAVGLDNMLTRKNVKISKGGRGRIYAWFWGYWGRSAVYMYRATDEARFLDLFVDTYKKLLAERDDRLGLVDDARKVVVPSWGTLFEDGTRANHVTTAGLITLPVC